MSGSISRAASYLMKTPANTAGFSTRFEIQTYSKYQTVELELNQDIYGLCKVSKVFNGAKQAILFYFEDETSAHQFVNEYSPRVESEGVFTLGPDLDDEIYNVVFTGKKGQTCEALRDIFSKTVKKEGKEGKYKA